MDAPLLAYNHVEIGYDGVPVVRDVSLAMDAGEVLCVVGESGSGKSTLVRAGMGLLSPGGRVSSGDIAYAGVSLLGLSARELRRLCGSELAMVFQDSAASFVPVRRMGEQVYEAMRAHRDLSRAESDRLACDMFERLGLDDPQRVLQSYPFELSGGMGQRVGIACALLSEPRVLFADEPTSALDTASREQVVGLLRTAACDLGCAIMLVTHDMRVARSLASRVVVLRAGEVVEQGPARQVLDHPRAEYTCELLRAVPGARLAQSGARTGGGVYGQ